MQHRSLRILPLAVSIALIGCTSTGVLPISRQANPDQAIASKVPLPGHGLLEFRIDWQGPGAAYAAQAVPDRAVRAVVTLLDKTGAPAKDASGTAITPLEFFRNYGLYSYASWQLPAQSDLKIRGQLFDAAGREVVTRERIVDVVPGVSAWISLDMTPDDAPVITSVPDNGMLAFDHPIVLTGANFGKSQGWKATALLEVREAPATGSLSALPPIGIGGYPRLPDDALTIDSDGQATLTLRSADAFWIGSLAPYFKTDSTYELWLTLQVDGVRSKPYKVSMSRTSTLSATVSVSAGGDAPSYDPLLAQHLQVTNAPFNVTIASGSIWTYRKSESTITVSGPGIPYASSASLYRVVCDGDNRQGRIETRSLIDGYNSLPSKSNTYDLANDVPFSIWSYHSGFQPLPDEMVDVPGLGARLAKHYSFSESGGYSYNTTPANTLSEVWIVPTIGLVKRRDVSMYGTTDQASVFKRIASMDLTDYASPSTVN